MKLFNRIQLGIHMVMLIALAGCVKFNPYPMCSHEISKIGYYFYDQKDKSFILTVYGSEESVRMDEYYIFAASATRQSESEFLVSSVIQNANGDWTPLGISKLLRAKIKLENIEPGTYTFISENSRRTLRVIDTRVASTDPDE